MELNVRLAGITIGIKSKYNYIAEPLKEFVTDELNISMKVVADENDIDYEWFCFVKERLYSKSSFRKGLEPLLEKNAIFRKIVDKISDYSVLLIHGVVISNGKDAFLISAPSGIGKTTRAIKFISKNPDFYILNGDKPLLRLEEDKVVACGSPWKGKEQYGINGETPLRAILLLERSERTILTELDFENAFTNMLEQVYLPDDKESAIKVLHLVNKLCKKVKIFKFESSPTASSVMNAWNMISKIEE